MKEKDLEKLSNKLFGVFDPEDESSIGGDKITYTSMATFTPNGLDAYYDLDNMFEPEV